MPLVTTLPRREFLAHYWDYNLGEHVTFWEPTQQGKTRLLYEMLGVAMRQNPGLAPVSLMPKSLDPATSEGARRLGLKLTDRWPPAPAFGARPPGYVLWPKHLPGDDPKPNREHLRAIFRRCLARQLRKGNSLTVADDVYQLAVILDLNMDIEEILTIGGGAGAGIWLAGQKASGTRQGTITTFALNSPTHLVFGHDPYIANRKRLDDISGVDMHLVARIVQGLRKHRIQTPYGPKNISEKLYLRKDGPYMAIIGL